jgi:hypothetical protein
VIRVRVEIEHAHGHLEIVEEEIVRPSSAEEAVREIERLGGRAIKRAACAVSASTEAPAEGGRA